MKYPILLIIFSIALISSTILAAVPIGTICGTDPSSCTKVTTSKYQTTLGVSNSYIGIGAFTLLILLTVFHMRDPTLLKAKIIRIATSVVAIGAAYFIFLQVFILKAFCKYCMVVDIGSLLAVIFVYFYAEQDLIKKPVDQIKQPTPIKIEESPKQNNNENPSQSTPSIKKPENQKA